MQEASLDFKSHLVWIPGGEIKGLAIEEDRAMKLHGWKARMLKDLVKSEVTKYRSPLCITGSWDARSLMNLEAVAMTD